MAERLAARGFAARARSRAGELSQQPSHAGIGVRGLAYILDSLVLFAFAMVFVAIASLNVFLRSDSGRTDPSDGAIDQSVLIVIAVMPCWLVLNLLFSARRGQTAGQYLLGLRLVREDERRPGLLRLLLHWLALHPLLFHPFFAAFWALLAVRSEIFSLGFISDNLLIYGGITLTLLCLGALPAGILFLAGDPDRRTLHDRIARVRLVHIE